MEHSTEPSRYRIVIRGRLGERLASAFESFEIESRAGESSLTGAVRDQAALHGLLDRLRDLGIPIVSVNQIDVQEPTTTKGRISCSTWR